MKECLFCRIVKKEIPSQIVYEDDAVVAFKDINPQAPVHVVIAPRKHLDSLNQNEDFDIYSDIMIAVNKISQEMGIQKDGYRVVANCNDFGGQTVYHIHFHLLGGRIFRWPPG